MEDNDIWSGAIYTSVLLKNLLQIGLGPLGINFRQWTQGLSSYWHGDHRSGYIFFEHTGELRIISLKGEERVVHRPEHTPP